MGDLLVADELGEATRSAKTTDPRRHRVTQRNLGAAGIGIDGVNARARKRERKLVGVAGSPQDEGTHRG